MVNSVEAGRGEQDLHGTPGERAGATLCTGGGAGVFYDCEGVLCMLCVIYVCVWCLCGVLYVLYVLHLSSRNFRDLLVLYECV